MGKPSAIRPPMTAHEFLTARNRLGLSQAGVAGLCGVDGRTVRKWENGERNVPEPAANFLRYLLATGATGIQALDALGIVPPPGME